MPRIPSTPSVKTFTETWSADFKDAVTKAAGKNGKLSVSEAKKLAASATPDKMFADTALNLLKAAGNTAQSIDSLVSSAKAYAQRAAQVAAGPDGKLSLADGAKLPSDLVEDFFMLRGKTAPGTTPVVVGGSALPELKTKLDAATADLWLTSETDAKLKFISGGALHGAAITPALVRAQLGAQHDVMIPDVMYVDPSEIPLAGKTTVSD